MGSLVLYLSQVRLGSAFIWGDFVAAWKVAFRTSALGWFWQIVLPIVPLSIYVFLASIRVLPAREDMPPVVYILFGFVAWSLLSDTLLSSVSMLAKHRTLYNRSGVPLAVVFSTGVGHRVVDLGIQLAVAIVAGLIFLGAETSRVFLAIVWLAPGWILMLSVGNLLAIMGTFAPDLVRVVQVLIRYLMFLSAVIFPIPDGPWLEIWKWCNPFINYVTAFRDGWVFGSVPEPGPYLFWSLVGLVLFWGQAVITIRVNNRFRGMV